VQWKQSDNSSSMNIIDVYIKTPLTRNTA